MLYRLPEDDAVSPKYVVKQGIVLLYVICAYVGFINEKCMVFVPSSNQKAVRAFYSDDGFIPVSERVHNALQIILLIASLTL